jgi:hypothetical protein
MAKPPIGTVRSPMFSCALLLPRTGCRSLGEVQVPRATCVTRVEGTCIPASLGNVAAFQGRPIFTPELYVLGIHLDLPEEIVDDVFHLKHLFELVGPFYSPAL